MTCVRAVSLLFDSLAGCACAWVVSRKEELGLPLGDISVIVWEGGHSWVAASVQESWGEVHLRM